MQERAADPQQWVLDARFVLGGDVAATAGFVREVGRTLQAEASRLVRTRGLDGAAWLGLPASEPRPGDHWSAWRSVEGARADSRMSV
jgi:hypothetical protein